ncbi:hypothetical protein PCAR4_150210 [Paraburkholderia caribensis]|nr:hypothetical protein PCAR4_150210 [Paraburkholderia caribensis]
MGHQKKYRVHAIAPPQINEAIVASDDQCEQVDPIPARYRFANIFGTRVYRRLHEKDERFKRNERKAVCLIFVHGLRG